MSNARLKGAASQAHAFNVLVNAKKTNSYLIRIHTDATVNTRVELKSMDKLNQPQQLAHLQTGNLFGGLFAVFLFLFNLMFASLHIIMNSFLSEFILELSSGTFACSNFLCIFLTRFNSKLNNSWPLLIPPLLPSFLGNSPCFS